MRVTTKGQVTIPIEIRRRLKIAPASEVEFIVAEDGRVYVVRKKAVEPASRFEALRGVATVDMSTEEIMALTRGD